MTDRKEFHRKKITQDLLIIACSVIIAVILLQTGALHDLIDIANGIKFLGNFIAGMFFTSVFTTPIAIVTLGEIAQTTSPVFVAIIGAIGAVIGDLILFVFMRDNLAKDVAYLLASPSYKKFRRVFKLRFFRWFAPFLGALIIASPLPDELGIAMMGFSRLEIKVLIPISFIMNFLGILAIGYGFRLIS